MKCNPINQHYIPQFLLRKFTDDKNSLYYYDKEEQTTEKVTTREIFAEKNLYTDKANHPEDAYAIEKDLGDFEREAAGIIGEFATEEEFDLSVEEDERL